MDRRAGIAVKIAVSFQCPRLELDLYLLIVTFRHFNDALRPVENNRKTSHGLTPIRNERRKDHAVDELTGEVSLIVTDFGNENETNEIIGLWNNHIHELKRIVGS